MGFSSIANSMEEGMEGKETLTTSTAIIPYYDGELLAKMGREKYEQIQFNRNNSLILAHDQELLAVLGEKGYEKLLAYIEVLSLYKGSGTFPGVEPEHQTKWSEIIPSSNKGK